MVKRAGSEHYEPIEWDEAFGLLASELNALDSPDEAVFYTSGRTSNEAAFAYQLFAREFGTNNMPDCSNMCHESSGSALSETIGIGKGSVLLEDLTRPTSSSSSARTLERTTRECSRPSKRPKRRRPDHRREFCRRRG